MKQLQSQRARPTRPKTAAAPRKAAAAVRAPEALPNHRAAGELPNARQTRPDVATVVEQARRAPRTPLPHAECVARELGISPDALEVHRGAAARDACETLGARAFAVQNIVVFAQDDPSVACVRHELAHVIQQRGTQSPARSHYAEGSLTLSHPGDRAEIEAAHFAPDDLDVTLSAAPVTVCRVTKEDDDDDDDGPNEQRFELARKRLGDLAQRKEFALVDYTKDKEETKFGIGNGKEGDDEEFDPVFVESSEPWRLKDYVEAAKVTERTGRSDLSERVFRRVGKTKLADDAIARFSFVVPGRKKTSRPVWAARVVPKDVPAAENLDAITTRYVFIGAYYTEGTGGKGRTQRVVERELNQFEVVNDKTGKRRKKPDPDSALAAYAQIVDNIEAVAAGKKLPHVFHASGTSGGGARPEKKEVKLKGVADIRKAIEEVQKPNNEDEREKKAKEIRDLLRTWVLDNYDDVDELYAHIIEAPVFPSVYNAIKGAIFVEYIGNVGGDSVSTSQIVFGVVKLGKVKRSGKLQALRRGDGLIEAGDGNHILEGKARTEAPNEDEIEQMADYRIIVDPKKKIRGYVLTKGVIEASYTFTAVEYDVGQDVNIAKQWDKELALAFKTLKKGYRIHPNVSGKAAREVTVQLNPLLTLPIPNPEQIEQSVENVPAQQPGATIKRANFKLARPLEAELASGTLELTIAMKDAIKSPEEVKPKRIEVIPDIEAKPAKPGGPLVYGRVDNQFTKLRSSLDNFFKDRVRTDAKLVDDGVAASLWITPGKSGIQGIHLDEALVTATLGKGGLKAEGKLGLSNAKGTVKGGLVVTWSATANQWGVKGSVTFTDLIDGLKPITAHFEYDAATEKTRIWAEKVEILKKYGGVTLHGWATGLEYDVKEGEFSGHATLNADLGAFGEATASGDIEKNRIVRADLTYKTPLLKYPKGKPVLEGDIKGAITYMASEMPGGAPTFSGNLTIDAAITAAPLKKLAEGGRLAVVGRVRIGPNGGYDGSLSTVEALTLGKHFRIPPFEARVKENGNIALAFSLQVVNIRLIDSLQVDCLIDDQGFHFKRAQAHKTIGTEKDRVWGWLDVLYEEDTGFTVGGDIHLRIRPGMVAFGRAIYNSKTGEVDAQLGVEKIRLLHYGPKRKPLWDFSKQVELISFFKIIGIYLDVGFELAFLYDLDVWLQPTLFVRGLSFDDFSFRDIRARMKLFGKATATLEAAPNIGLGIFVISASLLRGGGGIRVPVDGTASLQLDPPLTVDITYSHEGEVGAGGTVGLTLLFGITAAIEPYAEIYVLGLWHPSWKWGPIYKVPLLEERPIFTHVVDFGKSLTEETDPPFATTKDAPATPATAKTVPNRQSGSAPQKTPAPLSTVEQDPIDQKAEAGKDGGFNLGEMVEKVKNQESFRPIRDVIEVASDIYKVLKFLFGPLIRFVKWLVGGAVELILKVLRVIRQLGAIIPAVREYLKARLHPVVFDIVSPMLDLMAMVEEDLLDLFELTFPKSPGEMITFSFTIIKKVLKLAWDSVFGLVEAIYDTIKAIGRAVNYFLRLLVEKGRIGAKRHVRYVGSETLGLAKYFLFPDQYKVIDVGGFSVGPKEDDDWYPDVDKGIAGSLWLVLHESAVQPTENYIDSDTGDPIENYWVYGAELKARSGGRPRLTPMVWQAVRAAAAASESEPLPLSMQRRLQTVPTPELSAIRIHTDEAAAAAAEALDAHAFTVGHDIYFGAGEYRPWTPEGERLLAHEVAHATWQARGSWPRYGDYMSVAGDDRERQADAFADALLSAGSTRRR